MEGSRGSKLIYRVEKNHCVKQHKENHVIVITKRTITRLTRIEIDRNSYIAKKMFYFLYCLMLYKKYFEIHFISEERDFIV